MWHSTGSAAGQSERWSTACGAILTSGPLETVLSSVREKSRRHHPLKSAHSHGGSGHPSNTQFLGPSESTSQTAFQSVQPFLKGSRSLQTDRLTDRPHNSNRPHLTSAAMWPNNYHKCSKNFDGRLQCRGDFSSGKFNTTFDCFCGRPIGTLVDSMLGTPVLL